MAMQDGPSARKAPSRALAGLKGPQDVIGGLVIMLLAGLALWSLSDLPAQRGFGFSSGTAPRIFAWIMLALGGVIVAQGFLVKGEPVERISVRAPLAILGSIVVFALLIRTLGLALTGVLVVITSGFATADFRWKEGVLFALAITAFCALLFPIALNQPIPLWPTFL